MRKTYEEWTKMTLDEQKNVPENELPEIPPEMLTNKLSKAVCKRVNGEIGWETTQTYETESSTKWFPEYRQKDIQGQMIWYKFDPTCGIYSMNLTGLEPSMEEEPIGSYGMQWIDFMEKNHPGLVEMLRMKNQFLTVARSVDATAWEYRELLDKQFARENPRPTDFNETLQWEQARMFYTDSAVMREKVLIPLTAPRTKN